MYEVENPSRLTGRPDGNDRVYISRGLMRSFPEPAGYGETVEVKLKQIGKGMFTKAYITLPENKKEKPRVVLVVNDNANQGGDHSKSALYEMIDNEEEGDNRNPHIPAIERIGYTANETVYEMPLYNVPLGKVGTEKAWAQYQAIHACWKEALEVVTKGGYVGTYDGHRVISATIECAESRPRREIPRKLVEALEILGSAVSNYGAEYSFEFSPRNLGTDSRGRLILLDVTFSLQSVRQTRRADRKSRAGAVDWRLML